MVGEHLREREGGFDGERDVALDCRVGGEFAEEELEQEKGAGEVHQEQPVRLLLSPLPETPGPPRHEGGVLWVAGCERGCGWWRAVVQGDEEQSGLHADHERGLEE